MYCHNTALVNQYIHECEVADKRHEYIELTALEKAEELISSKSDSDNYQSVMLSIYDNNKLSLEFDELVHAIVNNATIESVQKLQEFMSNAAYNVALTSSPSFRAGRMSTCQTYQFLIFTKLKFVFNY